MTRHPQKVVFLLCLILSGCGSGGNAGQEQEGVGYLARQEDVPGNVILSTPLFPAQIDLSSAAHKENAPLLSPDGTLLAYEAAGTLRVIRTADHGLVRSFEKTTAPLWSPDSTRLAVVGDQTLRVLSLSGSEERFSVPSRAKAASWSPDGRQILLQIDTNPPVPNLDTSTTFLGSFDLSRKTLTKLTSSDQTDWLLDTPIGWAADGRLYFYRYNARQHGIWSVNAQGTDARFYGGGLDTQILLSSLVLSPEGTHLAYLQELIGAAFGRTLLVVEELATKTKKTLVEGDRTGERELGKLTWLSAENLSFYEGTSRFQITRDGSGKATLPQVPLEIRRQQQFWKGSLEQQEVVDARLFIDNQPVTPASGFLREPSLSVRGTLIGVRTTAAGSQLWNTGLKRALTEGTAHDRQPALSYDGKRVVFASDRGGGSHLFSLNATGGEVRPLTSGSAQDSEPAFSPDGKTLAFVRDGELYLADANNGMILRRLTEHPALDYSPTFSPDGTTIAFVSERDGNPELYQLDVAGTNLRRLTNDPGRESRPRFALRTNQLYFLSDRAGKRDVFRLSVEGGELTNLTNSPTLDESNLFPELRQTQ